MTARTDSFEGLHVLLVTDDDARAKAIAKSLRERKAHVGDVVAGSRDPIALRGADLLVIDARRGAATDARVAEVRSDVRARWASVATIDYTSLASGDGTVDLRALEGIVSRLAGMDKALTERARRETSFEMTLAPLGPTRTLRALALAGPTLHVSLSDGTLRATVDLSHELLVASFAERGGERWEAWTALAHVLGLTDANVLVERREHASAMNIMEPVDQALEGAAQERAKQPQLFNEHVEELSGLHVDRREEKVSAGLSQAAGHGAAPRARTLVGVPPAPPPAAFASSARPSAARPSVPRSDDQDFADVPTGQAAPGLLQRMARSPANDAPATPIAPAPGATDLSATHRATPEQETPEQETPAMVAAPPAAATSVVPPLEPAAIIDEPEVPAAVATAVAEVPSSPPVLTVEPSADAASGHDDHDDYDDEGEQYDAGEVTVVADSSQLDQLREALAGIDASNKPLTSTMPAPPGPNSGELEVVGSSSGKPSEPTSSDSLVQEFVAHRPLDEVAGSAVAAPVTAATATAAEDATETKPGDADIPVVTPKATPSAPSLEARPRAHTTTARIEPAQGPGGKRWLLIVAILLALAAVAVLLGRSGGGSSEGSDEGEAAPEQR